MRTSFSRNTTNQTKVMPNRISRMQSFAMLMMATLCCLSILMATTNAIAAGCGASKTAPCTMNAGWVAIQNGTADSALAVAKGSILDFSSLNTYTPITQASQRIIINAQGKLAKAGSPNKAERFLVASWGLGDPEGIFPDYPEIDREVNELKSRGYNMLRFHYLDVILMQNQDGDFAFNSQQLDRFDYYIAKLKQNGIYIMADIMNSENGAYGDVWITDNCNANYERWQRFTRVCTLKEDVYFEASAQAHWRELVRRLYTRINPYTNTNLINDPAVAGLALVNENGFVQQAAINNFDTSWAEEAFSEWLRKKYLSQDGIVNAYAANDAIQTGEDLLNGIIKLPRLLNTKQSPRLADAQRFVYDSQQTNNAWMSQFLRSQGFQGLISNNNNHYNLGNHYSRTSLDWVDMHDYYAHPSAFVSKGSRIIQQSMLGNQAPYIRHLAGAKHLAKPFTVSEHGHVFWNRFRYEASLALPAYSALQSWDAVSQFGQPITLNYLDSNVHRRGAIHPFNVGLDPISRVTDVMTALLYLRGDVQTAKHQIAAEFDADAVFDHSNFINSDPSIGKESAEYLGLITGYQLNYQATSQDNSQGKTGIDAIYRIGAPGKLTYRQNGSWVDTQSTINSSSSATNVIERAQLTAQVNNLRRAGILKPSNVTNPATGVFHSDTEEILLASKSNLIGVNTPFTEGLAFESMASPMPIGELTVESASAGAMVAVSAMDLDSAGKISPKPLASSERMLLVLATDAQNTGMTFEDDNATTLNTLGGLPVLIRPTTIKLSLKNRHSAKLSVYAVDLKGNRREKLAAQPSGCNQTEACSAIHFTLNINNLNHGATTFFEIATDNLADTEKQNTAPTLSLAVNQSDNGQSATLTAAAFDQDNDISHVIFTRNNQVLNTSMHAPYRISWNPQNAPANGLYTFTATAVDRAGNTSTSNQVVVDVLKQSIIQSALTINAVTNNANNHAGTVIVKPINANVANVMLAVFDENQQQILNLTMPYNPSAATYQFNWDESAPTGNYELIATGYNRSNNVIAVSKTLNISIKN